MGTRKLWFCLALILAVPLLAQEADFGLTLPITFSAGGMYSHRWQSATPTAGPLEAGGQVMFYPSLKLGEHWYAYGAIDVNSSPYYGFQANSATNRVKAYVIQGFVAYTRSLAKKTVTVKAGQLASAFGAFPIRYDDALNPLLDAPLSYGSPSYGTFPVTLYGLPGVELDATLGRVDARFQFTNSSPANPQNLLSGDQHPNWTTGGGYTIRQGFRVGASVYHGAYLQVGRFLLPAENSSNWPFTAVGIDGQWARGRWSVNGEWQRFYYLYPRYTISPVLKYGYVEAKVVLHPRLYLAARFGDSNLGVLQPSGAPKPVLVVPNREGTEVAIGYRINRAQLLKIGYEWLHRDGTLDTRNNIIGVQLVTSMDAFSKTFR